MKSLFAVAVALAGVSASVGAQAASLNLNQYQLSASYALDRLGGVGLEASAVTYARDRGTLFFVGDEGLGVVEVSLTGATLVEGYGLTETSPTSAMVSWPSSMSARSAPTASPSPTVAPWPWAARLTPRSAVTRPATSASKASATTRATAAS